MRGDPVDRLARIGAVEITVGVIEG